MTAFEFENLWRQYRDDIYRFCLHLAGNRDTADELYQCTALKAFEKIGAINSDINPRAYIFSISARLYKNMSRKKKRRNEDGIISLDDEESPLEIPSAENVEELAEKSAENSELKKAIAALDEKYRVPLILYYFDERGTEFIAEVLKIPVGTVKSRLSTARERLKKSLEGSVIVK